MSYSKFVLLVVVIILSTSCNKNDSEVVPDLDFRQKMREFVQGISSYAKKQKNSFLIIPQNGQEILTLNGKPEGDLDITYVNAIDAVGREDLFYGYSGDDKLTAEEDNSNLISLCNLARGNSKVVLTTDYCFTHTKMDDSYSRNQSAGYVSFAASHRELDNIPEYPATINNENATNVNRIDQIKNFLYLINSSAYATKQAMLNVIAATNYDLVLIDLYFNDEQLTLADVTRLQKKKNGGTRLVICYMSIGEAENYRYYWKDLNSSLIYKENPDWPGNYAVRYWETDWQNIIYGNDQSYTKKILESGFDGVYLDIIEGYEYFE